MSENTILIPRKELIEGKEFYDPSINTALRNCQTEGFEAVYMPQIVDARIEAPKEARIWQTWWCAPSIKATGRTKQRNPAVVYAHVPNYFSDPDNIANAVSKGLVCGAGRMPQEEFQRLLDLEDNEKVFVVDYDTLRNSESGVISLSKALKRPQTVPFLGGQERAERYFERHKEVYGEKIGIWYFDDLADEPLGRLLFLGGNYNNLSGNDNLYDYGRFAGVRAEGAAQKIEPTLEQVMMFSTSFVPQVARQDFEQGLKVLYN